MLFSANDNEIYTEHVVGCQLDMKAEQTALKAKYKSFVTGLLRSNGHIGRMILMNPDVWMRTNAKICRGDGIFDGIFNLHIDRNLAAQWLLDFNSSDAAPPIMKPHPFRLGFFLARSRRFPRLVGGSCGSLQTAGVSLSARSWPHSNPP